MIFRVNTAQLDVDILGMPDKPISHSINITCWRFDWCKSPNVVLAYIVLLTGISKVTES